ncbi:hypothetical protein MNEG_7846 [Monoraphidium neglectum]|uniref:Nucleoporin Nup88 n=1 Tax=Monoraphidium neglectum TaxID=145388 RepID=A0A0D2N1H7_9CHLO|nr:hypothetical protein MNEG_7846 [Monoraphidium neglectum]KIZ00116.1 hypothetical protein MNEG_7846 [Monoraphidium neglectum]|eukprot:XP_013899135.1 hypothetical protein MNEG_7846 [Monoraphidium neglectum]
MRRDASAAASANGHQLLLVGSEDDEVPVLALVDLYGAELVDPGVPSSAGASPSPAPATRRLRARLTRVHGDFLSRRPGLRLLQAAWHPASPGHFACLASDGTWRLYNAADPSEPEQSFALRLPGGAGAGPLGLGGGGAAAARPAAFAWGPPGGGASWGQLAVLILATDGGVYSLCPVAPFGLRVAAGALRRLLASCGGGAEAGGGGGSSTARAWLQAAFPGVVHPAGEVLAGGEGFTVQPHLLETWAPALQGPLNAGSVSAEAGGRPGAPRGAAIAASARSAAAGGRRLFDDGGGEEDWYPAFDGGFGDDGAGGDGGVTCCAVLTALTDGRVYTHALDGGALAPAWTEGLPQCTYGPRMDVVSVRCECEAVPAVVASAAGDDGGGVSAGLPPIDEDDRDSTAASRPAGRRTASAPASRPASGGALSARAGVSGGAAVAAASAAAASGPMVVIDLIDLRLRDEVAGGGFQDDEDRGSFSEDEEDEEEELRGAGGAAPRRLRRVVLHACPEQPGAFWAVHDRGAWALSLRWLPAVARQLAAAAAAEAEGFGGLDGYGGGGEDGEGDEAASGQLPAPALRELLVSEDSINASAPLGSVLAGSSCVLLERSGRLSVARPGAAAGGGGAGGGAGAGGGGVDEEERLEALVAGAAGRVQPPDVAAAQAAVQELYAELRAGPRNLPEPQAPAGGTDVRTPAGKEHLAAQLAWLQGKYVRFVAMAHCDAINRAKQLQAEVRDQQGVAREVGALASDVEATQAELAERVERLQARHANLLDRLKVLALLHWGAPRPLSRAERDFSKQLEQREAIQSGRQRLETLREDLQLFLSDHPEARLPAALASMSGALSNVR